MRSTKGNRTALGGRTTRRAVARGVGAVAALALGLAGCSGGGTGPAPGTATRGTTGSTATAAPTSAPVTAAATRAPTSPVAGRSTTSTPPSVALRYQVTFTPVTEKLPGGAGTSTYPAVTVTGPDAAVGAALRRAVTDRIRTARTKFAAFSAQAGSIGGHVSEQRITVVTQVRWDWLYAVRLLEYRYTAGAAHPIDVPLAVAVDCRSGAQVRPETVFPRLTAVDVAVREALRARYPDAVTAAADGITVGPVPPGGTAEQVESYPTPAGLWVGVAACVYVCALGAPDVTVPWAKLPATRPDAVPAR